mgnify:CR=1 FL=1
MSTSADFIRKIAVTAGARWPELVVAQWHLESAQGTATSGRYNFFGLKGSGTTKRTTEYINGKQIAISANFIDFDSPEDCVNFLVSRWYKDWNGYKGVNNATSAINAAKMLQLESYATDPEYANKLIEIMSEYTKQQPAGANNIMYANLVDAVVHFGHLEHQIKAFDDLDASLTTEQRKNFTDTWRKAIKKQPQAVFPLDVPYFYQRDSKTGHGERMCQSSAIAMRIEQINPSIIEDDDSYFNIVNRFGDTVSQSAHQQALSYLGLKHQFRQNGTEQLLCELLDRKIAIPIGILHKGNISKPSGGGHWITLIGYDSEFFHCHDPFGELDLVDGGYPRIGPTDGKNQRYSRKNLMKRWLIASQSDGWLWIIEK